LSSRVRSLLVKGTYTISSAFHRPVPTEERSYQSLTASARVFIRNGNKMMYTDTRLPSDDSVWRTLIRFARLCPQVSTQVSTPLVSTTPLDSNKKGRVDLHRLEFHCGIVKLDGARFNMVRFKYCAWKSCSVSSVSNVDRSPSSSMNERAMSLGCR
jgi:hypothetical protein